MSTTNNNTANYTVENLIAKYYNYVNEHCPKSSEASEWVDKEGKYHFEEIHMPFSPEANVVEQLLVVLYKKVEGDKAQKEILDALSKYADVFYTSALSDNEMSFLCDHYEEVVLYLFAHREKWNVGIKTHFGQYSKVRERLVKEYVKPGSGAKIFIADTEYCELAAQFPNCIVEGFTGWNYKQKEVWALGQIRLKAMEIESRIVSGEEVDGNYTYTLPKAESMDVVIVRVNENKYFAQKIFGTECTDIDALYNLLKPDGKMLFFSEIEDELACTEKNSFLNFRERIVREKTISSLVEYEDKVYIGDGKTKYIMLVLTKSLNQNVSIIDETKSYKKVIPIEQIDSTILWPSYYMTPKPEYGISLSEIVSFQDLGKRWEKDIDRDLIIEREDGDWILSENAKKMPVVAPVDMSTEYKDANLCEVQLKLAGDPIYNQWIGWLRKIEQPCILLFGKKEKFVVGYINQLSEGGMATLDSVVCLIPKKGIDVRYVAALLLTPEVKNQIMSICEGSVNDSSFPLIINKVIVPNHNDKERLAFLSETNYKALISSKKEVEKSFDKKFEKMKADYINEVRMRKHDMRPHLRQLASSERLMLHYIDNINNLEELKKAMKKQIVSSHDALESISELVDHLSDEERFGEPERVNLNKFFEDLEINHNDNDCFTLETSCEEAISQIRGESLAEIVEHAQAKGISLEQFVKQYNADTNALYVNIAPVDLNRLVNNIVENARRHGFTDKCRNDYYFSVNVKINNQRNMYQIDFCNNGNPLPVGMTKDRYGLKGEKAGANAGTGSGGYIVRSIVEHYGGDYDVFTKDGITTIRIYLPKSSVE
jgi:hypothetical protein